ncbi:MAG: cytochrome d ubiquinol oxidase subunit II [Actinomycetota bacterium]|nr:cytochrome d ubiquinol oxidase subunit II [Actinomycetota bacterium]
MSLADVPLLFVLAGLVFYIVLAGPDFGAAIWQLTARRDEQGDRLRDLGHEAMAPVWEANHVWLIFVLTVLWTTYPTAFGSIASTLAVPLFIAGLGIVVRGAAYALRAGTSGLREQRSVDTASALSSVLTPFALGAALGGIVSGRVPVGNAAGSLVTSWLNPTSALTGLLAVVTSGYLAAVFLCADAVRLGEGDLVAPMRRRALGAGLAAGALSAAGLLVLREDAYPIYDGLVHGSGLPALIASGVAGVATLGLVVVRRFEPARYTAAAAVAAIVVGWALAQQPELLPGLTIHAAAAPRATLVAVIIAVLAGGALVFPSLALLFRLTLGGTLRGGGATASGTVAPGPRALLDASRHGLLVRAAGACLIAGFGLLTVLDAGWAHALGVAALLGFILLGFLALLPAELLADPRAED